MKTSPSHCRRIQLAIIVAIAFLASPAAFAEFEEDLARIDHALRNNPSRVTPQAVNSCLKRRNFALSLYNSGDVARAYRGLNFCFNMLRIPVKAPVVKVDAPTPEELQARARREIEKALVLTPDIANGLQIYRECAACHTPEGWGLSNGSVPQIAGQHPKVVIKQLADIRAGNRDNMLMVPYSAAESIGGAQAVADVAAYIGSLEINTRLDKGAGDDLERGKQLYVENCTRCHGANGEGNDDEFVPRIHSQHYDYLERQFEEIRGGKRRNANAEMVTQIEGFGEAGARAVLDYVSRLEPPEEIQAPPDWKNPDFVDASSRANPPD